MSNLDNNYEKLDILIENNETIKNNITIENNEIIDNSNIIINVDLNPENECFICSFEDAPLSACNCKTLYLHTECQLKLMNKMNTSQCSICRSDYKNIKYVTKKSYTISSHGKHLLILLSIDFLCVGIFFYITYVFNNHFFYKISIVFFTFILFLSTSIIYTRCKLGYANNLTFIDVKKKIDIEFIKV